MRDAAALDTFRWQPNSLNTANVVRAAAEKMYSERQKQKKSAELGEDDTTEPVNLTADLEPAQKRSRLDSPSSSMSQFNSPAQNNSGLSGPVPRAYHFSNTFQSSFQS